MKKRKPYIYIYKIIEPIRKCFVCDSILSTAIVFTKHRELFCEHCHIYYSSKEYETRKEYNFVSKKGLENLRKNHIKIEKILEKNPGNIYAPKKPNIDEKNKGRVIVVNVGLKNLEIDFVGCVINKKKHITFCFKIFKRDIINCNLGINTSCKL